MATEDKTQKLYRIAALFGAVTGTIAILKAFSLDSKIEDNADWFGNELENVRDSVFEDVMENISVPTVATR